MRWQRLQNKQNGGVCYENQVRGGYDFSSDSYEVTDSLNATEPILKKKKKR